MRTEINHFLDTLARAPKTIFAYRNALEQFVKIVGDEAELNIETYIKFLVSIRDKAASTQVVYTTAVIKFYKFCKAGNPIELREATELYTHKQGQRVVRFNREAVDQVVNYCSTLNGNLEALRDRAFVLTLAHTGLRISEACLLKLGDINLQEHCVLIKGKDDKKVLIRLSNRAIEALKIYLQARVHVEPNSRKPLAAQPLFARHDIRASKKIRPITTGGMWKAIKKRMEEAGLERNAVRLHDFRHYFVSTILRASGNLRLAQALARHENIQITQRYAHINDDELDKGYYEIFEKASK